MNFIASITSGLTRIVSGLSTTNFAGAEVSGFDTFIGILKQNFGNLQFFLELLFTIIFFVFKWALAFIDFFFVLLRQLCGLHTDFSSFDSIYKNDVIFQFIFNERVVHIMQGMLGLALVLIILLGIIAIIRSEYMAISDPENTGEIKNSKWGVWKNIFQSCMMLILVPLITIAGLIFSSAILQTLYNATSNSFNASLGSQIFVASTYEANAYRRYGQGNKKIPITYNFEQVKDYSTVTDWDDKGTMKKVVDNLTKYKAQSVWRQGLSTYNMFFSDVFFDMDTIDYYQLNDRSEQNAYNSSYDQNLFTYRYEYLVMGDLVDYLMKTKQQVYVKTAEEVLSSATQAGIILPQLEEKDGYINFTVNYNDNHSPIPYSHKIGATDEADGAVFFMCIRRSVQIGNLTQEYYEPINGRNSAFDTSYLANNSQYVVARGLFEDGKYPTAIRTQDGKVSYYRDKVNIPTYAMLLPHISYEPPEGSSVIPGLDAIAGIIDFVTNIDVRDFIPYIYFDIDFLHLFNKSETVVSKLPNASFYLDYAFSSDGAEIAFFYHRIDINLIILVVATVLILSSLLKAIFGALKRLVNICFLYLLYPAAIATIPLFSKSSFGAWVKEMTRNVLSLYGLVLGLNLGLMLVAVVSNMTFITPAMMATSSLSFINKYFSAWILNFIIQLLFILVGITFIFQGAKIISAFVVNTGKPEEAPDPIAEGKKVIEGTTEMYKKAGEYISGKKLMDGVKSVTGYTDDQGNYHPGFIPGSAIVHGVKNIKKKHAKKQEIDEKSNEQKEKVKQEYRDALNKARDAKSGDASGGGGSSGGGTGGGADTGAGTGTSGPAGGTGAGAGTGDSSGGGSTGAGKDSPYTESNDAEKGNPPVNSPETPTGDGNNSPITEEKVTEETQTEKQGDNSAEKDKKQENTNNNTNDAANPVNDGINSTTNQGKTPPTPPGEKSATTPENPGKEIVEKAQAYQQKTESELKKDNT